jgi:hypothetical protein
MLGTGDFLSAIQFVILLLLATVSGAYILAYTAHVFVTIAQQTAGGHDEITWPKDPWYDWIGKALHLAWLVVFWVVPLGFVLRIVGPDSLAASAILFVGVPAACFWLVFPITLLSSFSAGSALALFRVEVFRRMARCPAGTFGFYLLSAPLCAAGGAALYATLAHRLYYALPAVATVVFLYARLIGRYTRLLGRVRLKGATPKVDGEVRRAAGAARVQDPWGTPQPERKKERPRKKKKKAAQAHDPWAVPEDEPEAEPTKPMVEGYGLATDEPAPQRPKPQAPPPVEGYDVSPEAPPPRPKEVPLDGSPPVELSRIRSESEMPLPNRPLMGGVFTFPWYPSNLGTWGLLTLLFLGWGLVYTAMRALADRLT